MLNIFVISRQVAYSLRWLDVCLVGLLISEENHYYVMFQCSRTGDHTHSSTLQTRPCLNLLHPTLTISPST